MFYNVKKKKSLKLGKMKMIRKIKRDETKIIKMIIDNTKKKKKKVIKNVNN